MPFIETPAKKASDDRFLRPSEDMAGEEEDQRGQGRRFPITPIRTLSIREYYLQWQKGWPRAIQQGEPWRLGR